MLTRRRILVLLLALVLLSAAVWALGVPGLSVLGALATVAGLTLLLLWALWRLYTAFLWKVGRRLAFSYFLIGVLPIPLVLLLLTAVAYILSGYVLGHLFRDAVEAVRVEMHAEATERLLAARGGRGGFPTGGEGDREVAFALYRDGRRSAGDPRLPERWPAWLPTGPGRPTPAGAEESGAQGSGSSRPLAPFFAIAGASPTLATAAGDATLGVAAVYVGDLDRALSRRSDVWVQLYSPAEDDESTEGRLTVEVLGRQLAFKTDPTRAPGGAEAFFADRAESDDGSRWIERWWDKPFLWWGEVPGPLRALESGQPVADYFGVGLNAPPRTLERHLFSTTAELDVSLWSSLFVFAFLLFDVYAVAALMAGVMIYALSRAVNRLSRATEAVREGDFSVRIPVRRHDQVGELQRSFNLMAENLEQLVATATQKELLEKELAIARELQRSLVPHDLPSREGIEFATVFEPSAAIGGDYFDILRLDDDRLAVVVADVSGHGLPTGLRMAMLKSALTILVSEDKPVEEILGKLDAVVRLDREGRFFVTATLALLDFRDGTLQITNAGHPPTYVVHDGAVREVLLPGSPLGGLGHTWGKETVTLTPGDVVVWLSDGFIEARQDGGEEPFGYDGVERTLAAWADAGPATADAVRDALVAAVAEHTGGRRPEDDRTLVVMRYRG